MFISPNYFVTIFSIEPMVPFSSLHSKIDSWLSTMYVSDTTPLLSQGLPVSFNSRENLYSLEKSSS